MSIENFNSPMFGITREPFTHEREQINKLLNSVPVAIFQALNKKLNGMGYAITIDIKEEKSS